MIMKPKVFDNDASNGLDDDQDVQMKILASDGEQFFLSSKSARLSKLLYNVLRNKNVKEPVTISMVSGTIMALVVEYLEHHKGKTPCEITKPVRSVRMQNIVEDIWDAEFIDKMSKKVIFQIILAANYLSIDSLFHLGSAKIATLIKGKSPEEIKTILSDYTLFIFQKKEKKHYFVITI